MKKIGIICLVIIGIVCLVSLGNKKQETEKEKLDKILEGNNYEILDVRTVEEYTEGHVKGAVNIPLDELDEYADLDKTKTILVYCKSGVRSAKAYNILTRLGYNVVDLGAYETIDLEKE